MTHYDVYDSILSAAMMFTDFSIKFGLLQGHFDGTVV